MHSTYDRVLVLPRSVEEDYHQLPGREFLRLEPIDGKKLAAVHLLALHEDALGLALPRI